MPEPLDLDAIEREHFELGPPWVTPYPVCSMCLKRWWDGEGCETRRLVALVRARDARLADLERSAVEAFVARVNSRAERDMLAGNPVTGAHHRALTALLAELRAAR